MKNKTQNNNDCKLSESMVSIKTDKQQKPNISKIVWGYIQINHIEQSDNYSAENQELSIRNYAHKHKYVLTNIYIDNIQTNKSHSNNSEFIKLIESFEKEKQKPYAILVGSVNKFIRSAGCLGTAVKLVDKIINEYKVHVIDTKSGISACTNNDINNFADNLLLSLKNKKSIY